MKHNKDQILKAYRRFCDLRWPEDDICVDDPSPWCKECDFFKICEKHPILYDMPDSAYEEMERILEDYNFLATIFEDRRKQYVYDGFLNFSCEADCEKCPIEQQCKIHPSEWTPEDFKFLEKFLLQVGSIEDTDKSKNQDLTANENWFDNIAPILDYLKTPDKNTDDTTNSYEMVNAPAHYNGTECIENMEKIFGTGAVKHFCVLNAYKYLYRAGKKPGEDRKTDIEKANWYLEYAAKIASKSMDDKEYF